MSRAAIEFYTSEQLVDEIQKRSPTFLLMWMVGDDGKPTQSLNGQMHGDEMELLDALTGMANRMIRESIEKRGKNHGS